MINFRQHWEYFLAIEDDLSSCARYVHFGQENFQAFSIEFAQIILRAASECDVIARELTGEDKGKWLVARTKLSDLSAKTLEIPRFNLKLCPWEAWAKAGQEKPDWFAAYENIKHDRVQRFNEANLRHAVYATGGLLAILLATLKDEAQFSISEAPKLFSVFNTFQFGDLGMTFGHEGSSGGRLRVVAREKDVLP